MVINAIYSFSSESKENIFPSFHLFFFPFTFSTNQDCNCSACNYRPNVDGVLDDAVWQNAIPIKDLTQQEPIAGSQLSLQTDVRIIYDNEYFYIGVMCYDNEPDKIIARELKWDGFISADDNIKLLFDTFNDNRSAYWFGTNPLGAQDDALLTGFEMKDFNELGMLYGMLSVKFLITAGVPNSAFHFLHSNFTIKKNKYGVLTLSGIRRKNETVLWTSVGQNLGLIKIAEAGDLVGIENVQRGNPIYLKPYFTAGAQFINGDKKYIHEPGLDVKYGLTETLSLDATVNTDFAQVESDRKD